jgi:hypothetical protein
MIHRGINKRLVEIVEVKEMLRIIMMIGIWLRYKEGKVRNKIMEVVKEDKKMEIMLMGKKEVEVKKRIVKINMENIKLKRRIIMKRN